MSTVFHVESPKAHNKKKNMAIDPSFINDIPLPALQYGVSSLAERIDLYNEIKRSLPPHSLQDLDLTEELVLQFMRVKELQTSVLSNDKIPANQKAQVANAVASILGQLTKLQTDLHTAERFKAIENLMIRYMKRLPVDVVEAFIDEYERLE